MRPTIKIQAADEVHIDALAEIERCAAELFGEDDLPAHLRHEVVPPKAHLEAQRQGLLVVALESDTPVGYAISQQKGACLHLAQIDVHPRHQQNGIGTALLRRVIALAQQRDCSAVTLTTYCHVPWNAPWYEKHGFRILKGDQVLPFLADILAEEAARGLNPARRVAMQKSLAR